jgi:hypothetical protein
MIASAGAGCGGSFDPYNRLTSLRVLAIRSEPVAPQPGESSKIDAKVYPLPEHGAATYAWSWCPFATASGAACPISEDQASMLAGMPVSFTLTTAPDNSTTFTNYFPPALFETLCAGSTAVPATDCTDGYPIQLQLTVTTDNDQVQAVRPMKLWFAATPPPYPNANPTVMGLFATVGTTAPVPFAAGDPLASMPTLPRHVETVINTVIPLEDSEPYMGTDDNNQPALVNERLNLSWFVESGDTDHMRTAYIAGQVVLQDAAKVKWTPAFKKDYAPDTSQVVVIIRDDRQGVGWIDGTVSLEATP